MKFFFDIESKVDIIPNDKFSICFLKGTHVPVIITTSSFFVMVTEEVSIENRMEAVRSYFVYLHFLEKIGYAALESVTEKSVHLKTFLMSLVDFEGNYRFARKKIFPLRYFFGGYPSVSRCIGLGGNETFLLYHLIGEESFNHVLQSFSLQVPSPLSPDFKCHGLPNYFPCEFSNQTKSNSKSGQVSCIAFDKPWHPFHGIFVCHGCHRKVERDELVYYEANNESLIQEQRERME